MSLRPKLPHETWISYYAEDLRTKGRSIDAQLTGEILNLVASDDISPKQYQYLKERYPDLLAHELGAACELLNHPYYKGDVAGRVLEVLPLEFKALIDNGLEPSEALNQYKQKQRC